MRFPNICFAGRIIIRQDRLGGLDWKRPCEIPAQHHLPFKPPLSFCTGHWDVAADFMFRALESADLIDLAAVPVDQVR